MNDLTLADFHGLLITAGGPPFDAWPIWADAFARHRREQHMSMSDISLPDLLGFVLEAKNGIPGAKGALGIPERLWDMALPFGAVFGLCMDTQQPVMVMVRAGPDWQSYLNYMTDQFTSLTPSATRKGHFCMSGCDYAKMRLIFGGAEWAP